MCGFGALVIMLAGSERAATQSDPQTPPRAERLWLAAGTEAEGGLRAILSDRTWRRAVGTVAGLFGGLGAFFAVGPFVLMHHFGLDPVQYGLANLLNVAGYLLGSLTVARLARHRGAASLARAGAAVGLVGAGLMATLALAGLDGLWGFLGPIAVLTVALVMVVPAGTSAAMARHPAQAGLASALLGFFQIGAAGLGAALGGAVLGLGEASRLGVPLAFLGIAALAMASAAGLRPPPSEGGLRPRAMVP